MTIKQWWEQVKDKPAPRLNLGQGTATFNARSKRGQYEITIHDIDTGNILHSDI